MLKLTKPGAEIFAPDGLIATHLAIAAHADDIEMMALDGILTCFGHPEYSFAGIITTDGAGSSRTGEYAEYTDLQMREIRRVEQKKAAVIGEYSSITFLDYPSKEMKDPTVTSSVDDLRILIEAIHPDVIYIHNLADKHPTHVATALRTIQAIRSLPLERRPRKLYGCEVWRDLDWLCDSDKTLFQYPPIHSALAVALVGVHHSQIAGGKRYDLAAQGRRLANATFFESHKTDGASMQNFGMDLTPLISDATIDPIEFVLKKIENFADEVRNQLKSLS